MHHRVDRVLGQDAREGGLPDVRPDEPRVTQVVLGRDRVDRDHPVHPGIALDAPHEAAPQLPGHSCDEDDLPQDQRLPSARGACGGSPCFPR